MKIKFKQVNYLIVITFLIIINTTYIYGEEIELYNLYNDKSKIIFYDYDDINLLDETKILLIHKDGTVISVPKKEIYRFKQDYKIIGYKMDNINYIYTDANKIINDIQHIRNNIEKTNIENYKKIEKIKMMFLMLGIFIVLIVKRLGEIVMAITEDKVYLLFILILLLIGSIFLLLKIERCIIANIQTDMENSVLYMENQINDKIINYEEPLNIN